MSQAPDHSEADEVIRSEAARWVMRLDRGLTGEEQDAYIQWLRADGRHRRAMAMFTVLWDKFDQLANIDSVTSEALITDLMDQPQSRAGRRSGAGRRRRWRMLLALAAAIIGAVTAVRWSRNGQEEGPAAKVLQSIPPPCEQRVLEDGSAVQLNGSSALSVSFSKDERRVRLNRGEAHFTVAKNPGWPFVVVAAAVEVQAIGTAFDVRLVPHGVDVLVTDGQVKVGIGATAAAKTEVNAFKGQLVTIRLGGVRPEWTVSAIGLPQAAAKLAWRPRSLNFTALPLADVVAEFNRHNSIQLVVGAEELKELKLSGVFRSDNVRGFVRLMETDFGMIAEQGPGGGIILRAR